MYTWKFVNNPGNIMENITGKVETLQMVYNLLTNVEFTCVGLYDYNSAWGIHLPFTKFYTSPPQTYPPSRKSVWKMGVTSRMGVPSAIWKVWNLLATRSGYRVNSGKLCGKLHGKLKFGTGCCMAIQYLSMWPHSLFRLIERAMVIKI